jgi:hypothetical protein
LYGDSRGFRTRHHREHIVGDYKNPPPPGMYDKKLERSKKLMKQETVVLNPEWRQLIGEAIVEKLLRLGAHLLTLSMSGKHCHFLAKMPPGPIPRKWTGQAKKHAHFIANEKGWSGLLWAVRSKVTPVNDRKHQLNAYHYILRHAEEGAWIWDFRHQERTTGTAVTGLSPAHNSGRIEGPEPFAPNSGPGEHPGAAVPMHSPAPDPTSESPGTAVPGKD